MQRRVGGSCAYSLCAATCTLCTPSISALQPPSNKRQYERVRAQHYGSYIPKFHFLPTGIT